MALDLDEILFTKVAKYFRRSSIEKTLQDERTVHLATVKDRLTILSRALTGNAIEIYPAHREGGYRNNFFFFPILMANFSTKELNYQYYIFRTLYLYVQKELKLNWDIDKDYSTEESQAEALNASITVLKQLFIEFPSIEPIHQLLKNELQAQKSVYNKKEDYTWLYGKWMVNKLEINKTTKLQNFAEKAKQAQQEKAALTTLKVKAVEQIINVEVDKKQQEDYVLNHSFEKVETADEFYGNWRDFDGTDELEDHKDALEELNMKYTVRVDDTVHSVYQSDFVENTSVSESAEKNSETYHVCYNEWDYTKNSYKIDYCKVYPNRLNDTDISFYKKTIAENKTTLTVLRKMLANLNNKMQQIKRQAEGEEFDLDAVVDFYTDIKSQRTPSEKIYTSKRKNEKDLSILLLLDTSLSSDSYANNNRIIDVEKQVSILFGEILDEYSVDFAIDSFYSKTRNYATYQTLKAFDDSWNKAKYIIGAAQPKGYTRIGAALRHATQLIQQRDSQNKWVILISDGKPNDYDKYEGKYGVNDVKQALREMNQKNINAYALAIEANAKYYLPQMFGQNHFQILTSPTELLNSLVQLFEKIKTKA